MSHHLKSTVPFKAFIFSELKKSKRVQMSSKIALLTKRNPGPKLLLLHHETSREFFLGQFPSLFDFCFMVFLKFCPFVIVPCVMHWVTAPLGVWLPVVLWSDLQPKLSSSSVNHPEFFLFIQVTCFIRHTPRKTIFNSSV